MEAKNSSNKTVWIYEELLAGETSSIAALPGSGPGSGPGENGTESILVGGEKTVWRYNFK